ncbi:hypothetical protein AAE02nite_18540 [Adhaeribacter aerolatus]|uniref:FHA domain-containing protein n=1 Tax=Adhaeribacter aerolatus TaxID=670289 RepID=A0A512AWZ4_9BACT|nr:FHA domain-containing protein [Adhaeribacter aerolatus]GEO04190.1 hypothetical protein AAE02nite_18540 [Adhaeribacter aerolatus]
MASRATQAFATSFKVMGGSNVPAYTLEFLTPTPKYPKGSFETVIVPYIELGRENCLISFGDEMPTVSRKHAALERRGKETILKNLSKTNQTLVNGRPVINQYFLNSGDEIQLSLEGPKLRYNEAQMGTTKMAFTKRMNLVMRQAIRPYKRALIIVSILVLLGLIAGAFFIYKMREENKNTLNKIEASNQQHAESLAKLNAVNQSLEAELLAKKDELGKAIAAQEKVRKTANKNNSFNKNPVHEVAATTPETKTVLPQAELIVTGMRQHVLAVYLKKILVEWNGKILYEDSPNETVCSGFLLNDGLFVTARQCIDIHASESSELNFIANSGGKVTYFFQAVSPDEKVILYFTNHDLKFDASRDNYEQYTYNGIKGSIKIFDPLTGNDWAYLKTKNTQGIIYDKTLTSSLKEGTELFSLGYAYGSSLTLQLAGLDPYFNKVTIASSNNEKRNYIQLKDNGLDVGNTGGPLFYIKDNKPFAVAIVSGKKADETDPTEVNIITPLANLKN